jgi:caffeoyl-CoA O-methyltransferase
MSNKTLPLDDALYEYLLSVSLHESEVLARLREETARDPMRRMQIAPEQGQFMALLVRMIDASNCLEIGVYTGYSALCVAQALPVDGRLLACDVSEEWTAIARRYWAWRRPRQINLRLAPFGQTLDGLIDVGEEGSTYFYRCDKENYCNYYERILRLLRSGAGCHR